MLMLAFGTLRGGLAMRPIFRQYGVRGVALVLAEVACDAPAVDAEAAELVVILALPETVELAVHSRQGTSTKRLEQPNQRCTF